MTAYLFLALVLTIAVQFPTKKRKWRRMKTFTRRMNPAFLIRMLRSGRRSAYVTGHAVVTECELSICANNSRIRWGSVQDCIRTPRQEGLLKAVTNRASLRQAMLTPRWGSLAGHLSLLC